MKKLNSTDYCKLILKDDVQADALSLLKITDFTSAETEKSLVKILTGIKDNIDLYVIRHYTGSWRPDFYLLTARNNDTDLNNKPRPDKIDPDIIAEIGSSISSRIKEAEEEDLTPVTMEKLFPSARSSSLYIPILPDEKISTYECERNILYLYKNYHDTNKIQFKTLKTSAGTPFYVIKGEIGMRREPPYRYSELNGEQQRYAYSKAWEIFRQTEKNRISTNLRSSKTLRHKPFKL